MSRFGGTSAALLWGLACTYQGPPVPVVGDLGLLEGKWEGSYSSGQSGRSGSIFFNLKAGTDSAYGDVVMFPVRAELSHPANLAEPYREAARVLTISFVRCEDGEVTGRLDPYQDPDTGERIYTTFEGRLKGKKFQGTFVTLYPGNQRLTGKWEVTRKKE